MVRTLFHFSLGLLFASFLASCKLPTINLSTDEPIKADLRLRIDIYQYDSDNQSPEEKAVIDPLERQRDRMAEIQTLKDNRLVGENRVGLLAVRELPTGDYGEYVQETIAAENEDRLQLMRIEAQKKGVALEQVQKEKGDIQFRNAFEGEWVETEEDDGSLQWSQKRAETSE